ncbi:MAG TPA: hypothetical protein PLH86_11590 [Saprospiraceae bacterium]|nr:hypothetical protein [Saprospiraceae bacterium]
MNQLIKFVIIFLLSYGVLLFVFSSDSMRLSMNRLYSSTVEKTIQTGLPSAHIETQNVFLPNKKVDPQKVYLVYGNPTTIKREIDEARRNRMGSVKISTHSTQFYFFELFTVPLLFIISLFLATPMNIKSKIFGCIISCIILFIFVNVKTILYAVSVISETHIGIYELSESSYNTIVRLTSLLSLGFSVILSFTLWLILGFRKSSFANSLNQIFEKL